MPLSLFKGCGCLWMCQLSWVHRCWRRGLASMTWASDQSISWPVSIACSARAEVMGVGCYQGPSVFLEVVHHSPSRLAYISGGAVTTRDFVHHSCPLFWWDRVFYPSQKVPESFVWFKTGSDAEGSQHSSDRGFPRVTNKSLF